MKKTIVAFALVLAAGFGLYTADAHAQGWGYNGMMGPYGMMGNNGGYSQAFMTETTPIRTAIAADRAEMNALMAGPQPDPQRVRALSERISANETALAEKARSYEVNTIPGGAGYGMMPGMMGHRYGFMPCW